MLTIINFLICFFILLILYQIFLAHFDNNMFEGFTQKLQYKKYNISDSSNNSPLELQNSNNISVLNSEVIDMSYNIANIQKQINSLVS